jgi:hypothetical protein
MDTQGLQTLEVALVGASPDQGTAIDLLKNGVLWLKSRSQVFWARALFGMGMVGAGVSVLYVINSDSTPTVGKLPGDNSLFMSQTSPQLLSGITPDTPPRELIQKLQEGMKQYETLLGQETNLFWQSAYIKEAHRLRGLATKEAQSGQFLIDSPFPAIDLKQCPAQLGDVVRCVLFRMQLEGVNALWEGSKVDDLELMQRGYSRWKASSIALNPPGMVAIDSDRLVSGLIKQTVASYTVQQAIAPASTNPSLQLKTVTPGDIKPPESNRDKLPTANPIPGGKP